MWQFDLVKLDTTRFDQWDAWAMSRPEGCVFYSSHWLRAASGKEPTIVAALGDYNRIIGGFAFIEVEKKNGFHRILPPPYTPYFAPIIPKDDAIEGGEHESESLSEVFMQALQDFLKPYDGMRWRPFNASKASLFQKNAKEIATTRTMILANGRGNESYSRSLKTKLNKAQELGYSIDRPIKTAEVYELALQSMQQNGNAMPLNKAHFIRAFDELIQLELAFSLGVRSAEGELLAAAMYMQDLRRVYNLVIGTPRNDKHPAAGAFLHQAAVERTHAMGKDFDFEGSMLKGVYEFYRRFGAEEHSVMRYSYATTLKSRIAAPLFKSAGKSLY